MFAEFGVLNFWTYVVGAFLSCWCQGPIPCLYLNRDWSRREKGYLAATGVFIGDAVLMFLAWAGVAALIQTTPVLFNIVRYLGAFYLLWLGGKMLWSVVNRQNNAHERPRACQYDHEARAGIKPDESQSDSVLRLVLRSVH